MNLSVVPKLGKILKERNMTQSQLSEMTGINQAVISRFDKNKQHQDLHLFTIAKALNIKIEDMFEVFDFDIDKRFPFYRFMDDEENASMIAESSNKMNKSNE